MRADKRLAAVAAVYAALLACGGSTPSRGEPNRAPVAHAQSVQARAGIPQAVLLAGTDAEGDPLTYRVVSPPTHGTLQGEPPSLTYVGTAEFGGTDAFAFVVSDGRSESSAATVTISVTLQRRPLALPSSTATVPGQPVAVTLAAEDPDGDPLTFAVTSAPVHGTLTGAPPVLTYTPEPGFVGSDVFTFAASDGFLASDPAFVTVLVEPRAQNLPPVASADVASTKEGLAVDVRVTGNDHDPESGTLTVSSVTQGSRGAVAIVKPDTLRYTPAAGFQGTDAFSYTVRDALGATATATVTVRVTGGALVWARRAGGAGMDAASAVGTLSDGSVVVAGQFHGEAVFGAGQPNETTLFAPAQWDAYIARYTADGALLWARRAGGTASDIYARADDARGLAVLPDDSVVVVGTFMGSATFGAGEPNETTLTSAGGKYDLYLARLSPGGDLVWARSAGGSHASAELSAAGVAALPDGSVVLTGATTPVAPVTFGRGEANETAILGTVFVARYHADGRLAWVRRASGVTSAAGMAIAAHPDGSSIVTGAFGGTTTFDGGGNSVSLVSGYVYDVFVARYGPDGTLAWAKRAGGPGYQDYGLGIAATRDGGAVVTGAVSGAAVFGPGEPGETTLLASAYDDVFVALYRADGTLAWARLARSIDQHGGRDVAVAEDGTIYVAGVSGRSAVFGGGEETETMLQPEVRDAFLARYGADGRLLWASLVTSSTGGAGATAIALGSDGSVALAGTYRTTATLGRGEPDPTALTSAGDTDVFVARLRP